MLNAWTQFSGYSFGTISERVKLVPAINLPVSGSNTVTYSVISGSLPGGLRIEGNQIVGTPYEVPRVTEYTFCIRQTDGTNISDRTYKITVEGADSPEFSTPAGDLAIGENNQFFVMDSSYVDYQIQAFDADLATGQTLSYFIASGDGELPPGLTLTKDGRIVGLIKPVISIKPTDGNGTYDNSYFDAVAFDFAYRPTNGFDSYIYDTVFFDYSLASQGPRKLNRNYEFVVSVTDGDVTPSTTVSTTGSTVNVTGSVIGDTLTVTSGSGIVAGMTLYSNSFGFIPDTKILSFGTSGTSGTGGGGTYKLSAPQVNNIAPLTVLSLSNETYVTSYVAKRKFKIFVVGDDYFRADNTTWLDSTGLFTADVTYLRAPIWLTPANLGTYRANNYVTLILDIYDTGEIIYTLEELNPDNTPSTLPPGMEFDLTTAEVYGTIPYQPAITKVYTFTVTATRFGDKGDQAISSRTFTVRVIGEVDSVITWNTAQDLGTINANFVSTLKVEATTTVPNAVVLYTVVSGSLPPGLSLDLNGEIVGKVNQYATLDGNVVIKPGLTTFDNNAFSLDGGTTTVDRVYTCTILARDQLGYSATTRTFTITIETPNQLTFSNIRTKPFLNLTQRAIWKDFINNTTVFTPGSIYRPNDPNFGVQSDLSLLVYAGIETSASAKYISAIGLNHKRKRFHFGSVKKAVAVIPGTTDQVYEVVYVEMIDPLESNGKVLPKQLKKLSLQPNTIRTDNSTSIWETGFTPSTDANKLAKLAVEAPIAVRPDPIITTDSTGYQISNPNADTYFPSSVSIWRDRIKNWADDDLNGLASERNYLPLWMRSIQPGGKQELGFQLAVPLCYCKLGMADDIILNIKFSGFDFKVLDYTADRYIIDSVEGSTGDKYLVFKNDRITV